MLLRLVGNLVITCVGVRDNTECLRRGNIKFNDQLLTLRDQEELLINEAFVPNEDCLNTPLPFELQIESTMFYFRVKN